jgi:hypothetical protein
MELIDISAQDWDNLVASFYPQGPAGEKVVLEVRNQQSIAGIQMCHSCAHDIAIVKYFNNTMSKKHTTVPLEPTVERRPTHPAFLRPSTGLAMNAWG